MKAQYNSKLHGLLSSLGLMDEKKRLILELTDGRTDKSSDLSDEEGQTLIQFLSEKAGNKEYKPVADKQKMRRKILACCHEMGWYVKIEVNGKKTLKLRDGKPILDYNRVDEWCLRYATDKKRFNDLDADALVAAVTAFERMKKEYINNKK